MSKDTSTTIALIDSCLQGHRLSQRQLYEQHLPYALTVTRRFGVASRYRADVIQEVFTDVFATLERFDPEKGKFTTWLRAIAVRRSLDFLRKREKLRFTELVAVTPEKAPDPPLALAGLSNDELFNALKALPLGYRTVFNLYAVDGYRHTEIAKILGISASASRSQYARAKARLRKHLSATPKKKITHEH